MDCCYFPLYEIENGKTAISYNPEEKGKKRPVLDWLSMMGRTKHLKNPVYGEVVESIQAEIDRRWARLKAMNDSELL